ncbi:MAG: hypothetical protein KQH59_20785 [Desulfobulbaceae bacterium]|nr:hypothetical protein [Desulfobulbaceae bacterium]
MKSHVAAQKTSYKKTFALLVAFALLIVPALAGAAIKDHTIQIEFIFDYQAITDKTVTGYRLYKDGDLVCETSSPDAQYFDCVVTSTTGVFDFTLTARYDNGTESPPSTPFPLTIFDETSPVLALLALTGQLPNGIEGLGAVAGNSAVDLADVIHLLRQGTVQ